MSQKPRSQRKWLHRAVAMVIVLASYFTVHYATVNCELSVKWDDLGHSKVYVSRRKHWLDNTPLPRWVESFFQPASQLDDLIGWLPPDEHIYDFRRPDLSLNSRPNRRTTTLE
ncbi:MAG TPA: hypothetical protein VMR25_23930 [Planctomycetaceae bacterium]|jgi:hypothetical protein|nr:hypothetical protein [Planctomycetaceae bacterium]